LWSSSVAAVAFDCFGTLADFAEPDFIRLFGDLSRSFQLGIAARELWDLWLRHGRELAKERGRDPDDPLAGPEPSFVPMRDIWLPQFERTFATLAGRGNSAQARQLMIERLSAANCYPEVPLLLNELRSTHRLAVLSNADDDFLDACLTRNGLKFETVVSSESARSYKPRAPIFESLWRNLGLQPDQILYVGDSPVADLLGAHAAGMPVAWVNRSGSGLPDRIPAPELELAALSALPEFLGA
jgi:2-haloalkanoic acid dehalogenase type II